MLSTLNWNSPPASASAISVGGLADARENDPVGRNAGGAGPAIFAIETTSAPRPALPNGASTCALGLALTAIGDQRLARAGAGHRLQHHFGMTLHRRRRIDVGRGADRDGDRFQRDAFAVQGAVDISKWFIRSGA